jgi:hypothetical protein
MVSTDFSSVNKTLHNEIHHKLQSLPYLCANHAQKNLRQGTRVSLTIPRGLENRLLILHIQITYSVHKRKHATEVNRGPACGRNRVPNKFFLDDVHLCPDGAVLFTRVLESEVLHDVWINFRRSRQTEFSGMEGAGK